MQVEYNGNVREFISDMHLIFFNAMTYNQKGSDIWVRPGTGSCVGPYAPAYRRGPFVPVPGLVPGLG